MTKAAALWTLLAGLGAICVPFTHGRGDFVRSHSWLGTPLWIAGLLYAASMVVRYAVWMVTRPEERWTGDLIPVVFHIVLASFLLVVADHHRGDPDRLRQGFGESAEARGATERAKAERVALHRQAKT
jgi:hypothetical protein